MPVKKITIDGRQVPVAALDPDREVMMVMDTHSGAIEGFSDRRALLARAYTLLGVDVAADLARIDQRRAQATALDDAERAALESRQTADFASMQRATADVLKRRNVSSSDLHGLKRLHDAKEIGSLLVYDSANFEGDWGIFGGGAWPKQSWFGWNDRISSLYALGITAVVYQHTWFRGASLIIPLAARYANLGWWNNRISSMIIVG